MSIITKDKRADILAELSRKKAEHERLSADLQRYHDCDPEVMEQMKQETLVAKEAANRWTGKSSWIVNIACTDTPFFLYLRRILC